MKQDCLILEWIMHLPDALEELIFEEVIEAEGGKKMPYVLYAERKGRKIGFQEGHSEGRTEGRSEGVVIGLSEGLQQSIYDMLEVKFGDEGLALFPPVKTIQDIDILQAIRNGVKKAENLEAAKKVIAENLEKFNKDKNAEE